MWTRDRDQEGNQEGNQLSNRGCSPSSGLDPPPGARCSVGGRRRSSASDSGDTGDTRDTGDTGIGTCWSEDDSSYSPAQTWTGLDEDGIPIASVPPWRTSPSCSSAQTWTGLDDNGVPIASVPPWRTSPSCSSAQTWTGLDENDIPIASVPPWRTSPSCSAWNNSSRHSFRRWSSLTKLPSGPERGPARAAGPRCYAPGHGSLDRSRTPPRPRPLSSFCSSLLLRSVCGGSDPEADLHQRWSGSFPPGPRPLPPGPPFPHHAETSSLRTHQWLSSLRTHQWLTEQMQFMDRGREPVDPDSWAGGAGRFPWQHNAGSSQSSLPFNMLVKVNEGLLRQRELEIERQTHQILQLHVQIRANELQSQKDQVSVHQDQSTKGTVKTLQHDQQLDRTLTLAEWDVLHVHEFLKHLTQKYTEDVHRLEDKVRTRDRYISSLKKKRQRENQQNAEKQQRIETLERYLSELPTLDQVQRAADQEQEVLRQAANLQENVSRLENILQENREAVEQKNVQLEQQAGREKELLDTVHRLQQKVQQCLTDGVRVPVKDLKRLEVENSELLEQHDQSSRVLKLQKEQIDKLTSRLTDTSFQLQKKRQGQEDQSLDKVSQQQPRTRGRGGETLLLKEMSLVLLDLQALCSILGQRSQGKEPSLSLLLGVKSFGMSEEEEDEEEDEGLRSKLQEVGQMRTDIDELRKTVSDTSLSVWISSASLSDGRL